MKLTVQQVDELSNYLKKQLHFRESFEEVYDHILSALEHKDANVNFNEMVNTIIKEDFGGHPNLINIEKRISSYIADDCKRKFRGYFIDQLRMPVLLYYLPVGLMLYLVFDTMKLQPRYTQLALLILTLFPLIISFFRHFNVGYVFENRSASARDKVFSYLTFLPFRVAWVVALFIPMLDIKASFDKLWLTGGYLLPTIMITVVMIYNVAVIKLYRDEFRFAK